jgi:hypothetical protein
VLVQVSKWDTPAVERLKRLEASLLMSLLLLQAANSLPVASAEAQDVCSLACLVISHTLQAVEAEQQQGVVVLPMGTAPQSMLLSPRQSVAQRQQQQCQFVVGLPTPL